MVVNSTLGNMGQGNAQVQQNQPEPQSYSTSISFAIPMLDQKKVEMVSSAIYSSRSSNEQRG